MFRCIGTESGYSADFTGEIGSGNCNFHGMCLYSVRRKGWTEGGEKTHRKRCSNGQQTGGKGSGADGFRFKTKAHSNTSSEGECCTAKSGKCARNECLCRHGCKESVKTGKFFSKTPYFRLAATLHVKVSPLNLFQIRRGAETMLPPATASDAPADRVLHTFHFRFLQNSG